MQKTSKEQFFTTRRLTIIGLLFGISLFLKFTNLGFITIGPMSLTIMHIPVIIGAIIDGPLVGLILGTMFGIFSLITAMTSPDITAFIFLNPVISIGVRSLMGYVTGLVFSFFRNGKNKYIGIVLSSLAGTLTNTIGVLGLIYIFYADKFAKALGIAEGKAFAAIMAIGTTNGIPESILGVLITTAVVTAYFASKGKSKK